MSANTESVCAAEDYEHDFELERYGCCNTCGRFQMTPEELIAKHDEFVKRLYADA